jgi:hypothetical protein
LAAVQVDLAVDGTENCHLFWASARDALALADKGAIHIIYPTRRNLERLADFPDFAACRAHAQTIPVVPISPRMVLREGCEWLMIPPGHGYPVLGEPLRGNPRLNATPMHDGLASTIENMAGRV